MTSPRRRVLVVGVGSIGERHTRCFLSTGQAEVSICEPNAALRQTVAERYGIERAFGDLDAALADKPGAVVVCTPAQLHIPIATAAAKAGAHLLIEKPLSTSLDGIEELKKELAARGLVAAAAYVSRAHPALAAMREAIVGGRFGEPLEIVATSGQHFPLYRPAYREIYYKDRATGGGAVQDALTHVINAAEWLVGPVDRLAADIDHQALAGVTVEDTVHVLTRHGRVMGAFSLNQHQAPNESTITVVCAKGTARFEYHQSRWRWMTEPGGEWRDEPVGPLERDTLFVRQAEAFLACLSGAAAPACTIDEAVQTLRVNLGILAAAEQGRWQTIGPTHFASAVTPGQSSVRNGVSGRPSAP
ncbi:MAG TPA: Gfo/Idh/MocA family oxidoreductase [Pirellulales bacterium]|nr:Gfo/Idh/MocA family oxidoreductase [Pirellulales bacterium]